MSGATSLLRLGLVGAGRWGSNIIRAAGRLDGAALVQVATRSPRALPGLTPEHMTVGDWRQILEPAAIDAVIVATPPASHAEIVLLAIRRAIPVFVEKPLAPTVAEAEAIAAAAADVPALVMVDHTHLFSPAFRELQRLQPTLGRVTAIDSEAGDMGPFRADVPVLWDWGPHDVAMGIELLGVRPRCLAARRIAPKPPDHRRGETIELEMNAPGEIRIRVRLSNEMPRKTRRLVVYCCDGVLVYDDQARDKLMVHEGGQPPGEALAQGRAVRVSGDMPLDVALAEFCLAVRSGASADRSLGLGVEVVRVLAECDRLLSAAA